MEPRGELRLSGLVAGAFSIWATLRAFHIIFTLPSVSFIIFKADWCEKWGSLRHRRIRGPGAIDIKMSTCKSGCSVVSELPACPQVKLRTRNPRNFLSWGQQPWPIYWLQLLWSDRATEGKLVPLALPNPLEESPWISQQQILAGDAQSWVSHFPNVCLPSLDELGLLWLRSSVCHLVRCVYMRVRACESVCVRVLTLTLFSFLNRRCLVFFVYVSLPVLPFLLTPLMVPVPSVPQMRYLQSDSLLSSVLLELLFSVLWLDGLSHCVFHPPCGGWSSWPGVYSQHTHFPLCTEMPRLAGILMSPLPWIHLQSFVLKAVNVPHACWRLKGCKIKATQLWMLWKRFWQLFGGI